MSRDDGTGWVTGRRADDEWRAALRGTLATQEKPRLRPRVSLVGVAACAGWLMFLGYELASWATWSIILMALALTVPGKAMRAAASRHNRRRIVRRTATARLIEAGHETAVREGLWWPEPDGTISVGGQRIDQMDLS